MDRTPGVEEICTKISGLLDATTKKRGDPRGVFYNPRLV
jgi:hypothetical protein